MSKQTEQREQRMAGFDRQIIEASPSGMILVDAQTDDMPIIYVNAAFEILTGYSSDEIVGHNCRFLQGNDRNQPDLDILRDAIKNKKSCTVTLRNYRKDGTLFWNELRVSPIFDADGQLTHFVGVQNDVTERKRSEQHLRFLNNAANDLLELTDEVSVYDYVGRKLAELLEKAIIVINKKQSDSHLINQGIYGLDKTLLGRAMKLLGYSPEGHRYPIHPDTQRYFGSEHLIQFDGTLTDWARDVVPSAITRQLEKWARINKLYFIGLQKQNEWFADVQIYTRDEAVIEHPNLIETFIRQASTALERIRIEGNQRESEKRHRLTLLGTRAGTWEWNIQTGETVFNERWADIVGYTLEELAPINIQTWTNLTHPDDLERSNTLLEKHFAGESDYYECETRMKHKDGHWVWVLDRAAVMEWDEEEKPLLMFGTHIEITERKQAEEALRDSEARYRILAHNVTDMISTHDPDGVYTFASPSCERLLGYTPEELVGRSAYELFHPNDLVAIEKSHQTIQAIPDQYTIEYRIRRKSGQYIWFETTSRVVKDETTDQPHLIIAVSRNVTERVQMQEALRQSEIEFRNLTEKSPDLIVRIDRDSTHLYANPAFATAIGLSAEEIVGKTNAELGVPEEAERELSAIREQIYETGKATEMDLDYIVNGELRTYHLRLIPEPDAEGNVKSIISVSRDVTDHKHAQQREFDLELERERGRLLTSFIQNAAHEFRTPLATINSSAYLMSRSDDPDRRAQKVHQVEMQINRITKLIDMQLMMSKLESSDPISPASVDISAVIQEVWQEMREEYGNIHEMRQELSSDLSVVPGNAASLAEALKQIIENACRFTPEGGTITLSARTAGEQVRIEVQDTGPGIPEDQRSRIFETFWRQDSAHSTPGFGLGLPIAQKIIEQHGGGITVEHVEGGGSRFRIMLPLSTPAPSYDINSDPGMID